MKSNYRCSLWLNYGVLINDHTLMLVNIVGSMLFLSYCFVFFIFAAIKRVVVRLLAISFIIVLCLVYYTQVYDRDLNHSVRIMGKCINQYYRLKMNTNN